MASKSATAQVWVAFVSAKKEGSSCAYSVSPARYEYHKNGIVAYADVQVKNYADRIHYLERYLEWKGVREKRGDEEDAQKSLTTF